MKKLYALFIAVDKYAVPAHNLNGCVNDMTAVQQFLKRYAIAQNLEFSPKILTNQDATRSNVIGGFDHFKKAKSTDICFFYYSGHGSQSTAPKAFWTNPNGMNESIVCHDSRVKGGRDLMDKELGYLIWKATKRKNVHFLAMMDCCHSGSATRSLKGSKSRNVSPNFTPLRVEDYLGYKNYENQNGKVNAPVSDHILIAACRDNETAKEQDFGGIPRGVFTYSMVEVWENGGIHQSYEEMMQRARIQMEQRTVQQHPQLEGKHQSHGFLGMQEVKGVPFIVFFDKESGEWKVDGGGLQGFNIGNEKGGLKLKLENGKAITITEVMTNESLVSGMEKMDEKKQYSAWLDKKSAASLSIFISKKIDKGTKSILKKRLKEYLKVNWVKTEKAADYVVRQLKNSVILTKSGDEIPVFKRVPIAELKESIDFFKGVGNIAIWENILSINNPKTTLSRADIEIKVTVYEDPLKYKETDKKTVAKNPTDPIVVVHETVKNKKGKEVWRGQVYEIEVTNNSDDAYFINGVYLDRSFGINHPMNFNTNIRLESGKSHVLKYEHKSKMYDKIAASLDASFLSWGVNEITDYLKIFVSTEEMNKVYQPQAGLPLDFKNTDFNTLKMGPPEEEMGEDWLVFNLEFKITHPFTEVDLKSGGSEKLKGIKITTPADFSGKASLTNLNEVTRSLDYPLPAFFWKTDEHAITPLTRGMQQSDGLEVLEIFDTKNKEKVTAENPVILSFERMDMENELMIPWGVDAKTGMFYPLGTMDETGNIAIQTLPDETPTKRTRSLGGSIKIFFQKLTKVFYKHPLLQQVEVTSRDEMTYLPKDLAAIKATILEGKPKKIGLFIHGIIGDTKEMAKSVERVKLPNGQSLNEYYDVVLTFDYENLSTSIKQTAEDLKGHLKKAGLGKNHEHTLHIYAHSMGGLVSRWFIEKLKGDKVVSHLFQFGTPNGGSEWSDIQEMASMLLTNAVNGASFLQPYLLPLSLAGRYLKKIQLTLQELNPKSDFTIALNDGTKTAVPYSIVNGNTQLIASEMTDEKQRLLKKVLARFKSRGHYDALDLLVFKNPNDIAVTISSQAKLNEGTQFIKKVVGCDHISYFVNPVGLEGFEAILAERFETDFS